MEFKHSLALLHIGMMLGGFSLDDTLPATTAEATEQIYEIFEINMYAEPNVFMVRDKMKAIIEKLESEKHHEH